MPVFSLAQCVNNGQVIATVHGLPDVDWKNVKIILRKKM